MRKTLSLVLAVLMVLALLPAVKLTSAVAEDATTVVDVLTKATTGATGNSYSDWTYSSEDSGATYAGNSASSYDSIQLRSKSNSGIITTVSGGKAVKVTVDWNENTYATRVLNVYGSNTAYTSTADLYGDNAPEPIGTITYVQGDAAQTETEFVINDSYAFIALRSNDSAMYLNSISITWELVRSTN